jgi:hypothetical protein
MLISEMHNEYMIYQSESYRVDATKHGVLIVRKSDAASVFMQGEDMLTFLNEFDVCPANFKDHFLTTYDEVMED